MEKDFGTQDPWFFGTSKYERDKYAQQIYLAGQHLKKLPENILEIGSAEGVFSKALLSHFPAAKYVGVEIARTPYLRAQEALKPYGSRAEIINADLLDCVGDLPEGKFDLIFFSECVYYMGDRIPATGFFKMFETLGQKIAPEGVLVMAHIINQQDAPETPITRRPVMDAYRTMIGGVDGLKRVHFSEHTQFKEEDGRDYTYELWVFKKNYPSGLSETQ